MGYKQSDGHKALGPGGKLLGAQLHSDCQSKLWATIPLSPRWMHLGGKRADHLFSKLGGACSYFLDLKASLGPLAAIWAADNRQDSGAPGAAQLEAAA